MSTITQNAIEGLVGGASSIVPVAIFTAVYGKIGSIIYKDTPKNVGIIAFVLFSFALGAASGIVGGVLADSYTHSAYNGVLYGSIASNMVCWAGFLAIKYT